MEYSHTPIKTIADIQPGDHLCCIYGTDEEHRNVITPYLRRGLEQNEKVFYIVDARSIETVIDYLNTDGVDVEQYLKKGQLSLFTIADAYMKEGIFDPDRMLALLASETQKALDEGYSALRVTGEMSWALRGLPGSERLIEYEIKLNTFLSGSKCFAICQYDRRRFSAEILLNILMTHPFAVIGTELFDNFYYIPPKELLSNNLSDLKLNRSISNLLDHKRVLQQLSDRELRFRELFNNMSSGVAVYDAVDDGADFVFVDFNRAAETIEKIKKRDVIGRRVSEVFPGVREFGLLDVFCRVWRTGVPEHYPVSQYRDNRISGWRDNYVYKLHSKEIVATYEDVSEKKLAEAALRESEEKFRSLVEHALEGILILDLQGTILFANNAAARTTETDDCAELIGRNVMEFIAPESREDVARDFIQVSQGHDAYLAQYNAISAKGNKFCVESIGKVISYEGKPADLISIRDITERKRAEKALAQKTALLAQAEAISHMGSWRMVLETGRVTWSDEMYNIFGLDRTTFSHDAGEAIALAVHPEDRAKLDELNSAVLRDGLPRPMDYRIVHPDGTVRWVHAQGEQERDKTGKVIALAGFVLDITERKQAEEQLKHFNEELEKGIADRTEKLNASLEEKVLLLREIHHRVKNNLQIIISLLNLQSRYIEDEKTRQVIRESQNRVRSMALVHEKLYQSAGISKIGLDDYIQFLGNSLFQFYGMKGKSIIFTTDIQGIFLDINMAIPVGLIINELVSNSLKHAFPDERKGEIFISVRKQNHALSILFKDNGIGIPKDLDWRNTQSLGLRLVISLVEQLNGSIELDRSAGTAFSIVVKEKE